MHIHTYTQKRCNGRAACAVAITKYRCTCTTERISMIVFFSFFHTRNFILHMFYYCPGFCFHFFQLLEQRGVLRCCHDFQWRFLSPGELKVEHLATSSPQAVVPHRLGTDRDRHAEQSFIFEVAQQPQFDHTMHISLHRRHVLLVTVTQRRKLEIAFLPVAKLHNDPRGERVLCARRVNLCNDRWHVLVRQRIKSLLGFQHRRCLLFLPLQYHASNSRHCDNA